jgi:hypothetical protein
VRTDSESFSGAATNSKPGCTASSLRQYGRPTHSYRSSRASDIAQNKSNGEAQVPTGKPKYGLRHRGRLLGRTRVPFGP